MGNEDEIKYRVDGLQAIFLISASLAIDIIQALLNLFIVGVFLNRIVGPFVWLFFLTWFYFLGIKFTKGGGKNMGISIISMIIEMIPYVDLLPGWTVATVLLISASRREDKGKKPAQNKSKLNTKKSPATKPVKKPTDVNQKPVIGSEVKTKETDLKQNNAQKELNASQTTGSKTAEQKTAETSPLATKEQAKTSGQTDDKSKDNKDLEPKKDDGEKEKTEPGKEEQKREGDKEKTSEPQDPRTDWYKKQQGQPEQQEDLAEFEDLPIQKGAPLNEADSNLNDQEFSMGDPYREKTK